jgi:hypothetical protein
MDTAPRRTAAKTGLEGAAKVPRSYLWQPRDGTLDYAPNLVGHRSIDKYVAPSSMPFRGELKKDQ